MLPVFGGEVVEGEQRVSVLGQAIGGLVVFGLVLGKETIEGFLGIVAPLGHPDFSEIRLGPGLNRLWEFVEDVHRFVNPASLMAGGAELLLQRLPEPQRAVADRELGRDRQTAAFQIGQKLGPGLGTLAKASLKADQLFPALGRGADQNEDALLFDLRPGLQIDAVGPDVDVTPG